MRWARIVTVIAFAAWAGSALGADYSVELPPMASRDDAAALAERAGVEGARVARRYVRDTGWSYAVVVDGITDLDAARDAAGRMATADMPSTIYTIEGKEQKVLEVVTATPPKATPKAGAEPAHRKRGGDDGAEDVLDAAVKAHGGRGGGIENLAGDKPLRFVYVRTVPMDGGQLVARNTFLRRAEGARLEVSITEGTGKNSITVARRDGSAWVVVDGATTERDGPRAREVLDRFSPEAVLAVPLGLPDDVESAEAWRSLKLVGTVEEEGERRQLLEPIEKGKGGLISASFDPESHLLSRVTWSAEAGQLTFRYDDYRRIDRSLIVPFHARVERDGALVEEVRVEELVLDGPIDLSLFAAPPGAG